MDVASRLRTGIVYCIIHISRIVIPFLRRRFTKEIHVVQTAHRVSADTKYNGIREYRAGGTLPWFEQARVEAGARFIAG